MIKNNLIPQYPEISTKALTATLKKTQKYKFDDFITV